MTKWERIKAILASKEYAFIILPMIGLITLFILLAFQGIKTSGADDAKSNAYYYELELIFAGRSLKTYEAKDFNYYNDKSIRFTDANTDEYVFLYLKEADLIITKKIKGEDFEK